MIKKIRDILNNKIEDMNVIKDNIYALQNENKQYQKENELSTFTTAVMELIRKGLEK